MARIIVLITVVALLFGGLVTASGKKEVVEPTRLTILGASVSMPTATGETIGEHLGAKAKAMDIALSWVTADVTTGSTISMDALVASGLPPDIYWDYVGRVSKYIDPRFAADLTVYKDRFVDGYTDPFYRNGKLLGAPMDIQNQGLCINIDLLEEAGIKEPENWTIDEFMDMCRQVKKLKGKYGTVLFAKSQSADYLYMNWFASFGARMFNSGDYSKVAINSVGGLNTLTFFKALALNGYIPVESAQLVDDDAVALFWSGKVAAFAEYPGWEAGMQTALDQKLIAKPFRYKLIRFPADKGVTKVPASWQGGALVASKAAPQKALHALLDYFISPRFLDILVKAPKSASYYLPIKGIGKPETESPMTKSAAKIGLENGLWDQGATLQRFTDMRKQFFPILADLLSGKITPADGIKKYEADLNAVLK